MSRLSSIIGAAGAALLGGVIGGLLVNYAKPAASRAKPPTLEQEPAAEGAALEQRLAALERQIAAERPRLRIVRPPAAAASLSPDGSPSERPAADPPAVVDDPVFEAAVRDILERVDEERESERELRSEERRREAAQGWTAELAARAALRDDQKAKVLSIVHDYLNGLRDPRGSDSDGGAPMTRRQWRARSRELRDRAEQRLAEVLSHEQLNTYNALDEDQRIAGIRRFLRPRRD